MLKKNDNFGPPYWISHFEFSKSNTRFGSIINFIQIQTFLIFQIYRIVSAILNFENSNSDLDSATSKTFTLEIARDSEDLFLKNIFDTIFSFSPDSEGIKDKKVL